MEERKPRDAPPESLSRRPCAACREENSWALDRCVRVGAHLPPVCFPALQKSRRKIFRPRCDPTVDEDRKSTRLNSSHLGISYAVFCLKKKRNGWFVDLD